MKTLSRSTRFAVVPAVFAALALSACQDEAPTAAPPTPASPTAEQTSSPETGSPETSSPETTTSPETSDSPTTSAGGGGAGQCQNTSSFAFKKGSLEPKAQDAPQTATYKSSGGQAEIRFGKPQVETSGGDTFFPGTGNQTVIYPVTIKMTSGSYFIATRLGFGLVDGQDNSCKSDVLNAVLPKADEMPVKSLRPGDTLSKKVAFAIPAGADLNDYSLIFASDYSSGSAELAWKGK